MQTLTQRIDSITRYMQRKEAEIAIQTKRINQFGETRVGASYLESYKNNLQLWDNAKIERDKLKKLN